MSIPWRVCLLRGRQLRLLASFLLFIIVIVYLREAARVFIGNSESTNESSKNGIYREESGGLDRSVSEYRWWRYAHRNEKRVGPGERGEGVTLVGEEAERAKELIKKEAFNIVVSDMIALNRTLKDNRNSLCKAMSYPEPLPSASVVIIFHNEAWSPLLRTVHSVVNRSPPQYLKEVILLDDYSDREEVISRLPAYISKTWPDGVVKLVRAKQRSGLIKAKVIGAQQASGDVLIFLDSHCEANEGWLEPLLGRISESRTAVLCPSIDSINSDTLHYSDVGSGSRGGFWWSLHFSWRPIPQIERSRRHSEIDPIRSPTMAGGLLALNRKFFFEIGAYDTGMEVWGGENLEMSFRIWMCGGTLEFIPCSRVGHIFRSSHPYTFPGNKDTHGLNSKRLAEVWMDDYIRLFYGHRRDMEVADGGDVSDRVALRKSLGCHSFKWYLKNVYPEKFIPDENVVGYGMIRNPGSNLCLDTMAKDEKSQFDIHVFTCQNGKSASEFFSLTRTGELRREEGCCQGDGRAAGSRVSLQPCGDRGAGDIPTRQLWDYDMTYQRLKNRQSGMCLDTSGCQSGSPLILNPCIDTPGQLWTLEHVDPQRDEMQVP